MDKRAYEELVNSNGTVLDFQNDTVYKSYLNSGEPILLKWGLYEDDDDRTMDLWGTAQQMEEVLANCRPSACVFASTQEGREKMLDEIEGLSRFLVFGTDMDSIREQITNIRNSADWVLSDCVGNHLEVDERTFRSVMKAFENSEEFYSPEQEVLFSPISGRMKDWLGDEVDVKPSVSICFYVKGCDLADWAREALDEGTIADFRLIDSQAEYLMYGAETVIGLDDEAGMRRIAAEIAAPENGFVTRNDFIVDSIVNQGPEMKARDHSHGLKTQSLEEQFQDVTDIPGEARGEAHEEWRPSPEDTTYGSGDPDNR